jgi:hypothetical protein
LELFSLYTTATLARRLASTAHFLAFPVHCPASPAHLDESFYFTTGN